MIASSTIKSSWVAVAALLATVTTSHADDASFDQQIEDLRQRLELIEQSAELDARKASQLEDIRAMIAKLEEQIAASGADSDSATSDDSDPDDDFEIDEVDGDVTPGVQGAANPLRREPAYLTGDDLLDASFPNSLPIPGSAARFRIGGYVKADAIQDFDYVGDRYEFALATIAVDGTPEAALGGRSTFHAKETRINFDVRSVARNDDYGWKFPLQAFVEIDFFDDRDSFRLQPRLRHAYGVIGRYTFGRTWAITTDVGAFAGTVDFATGDSVYGGRVSQIRFTDNIGDSLKWAVGIEEASLSIANPFGLEGANRTTMPNFAGYLRWEKTGRGSVQLGVDVFQLEWQGGVTGPDDKEVGFGASLSGRYFLGKSGRDMLSAAATFGKGASHRVVSLGFDGGNDAVITPNGLDVMSHWQVYGGYSHYWTDALNSTIAVAWAELDNSEFQPGDTIHGAGSLHVNLVWFPYEKMSTGIEYMVGVRENNDGADGTAHRIQFMAKFLFN